jgi:hypothetical protein
VCRWPMGRFIPGILRLVDGDYEPRHREVIHKDGKS